MMHVGDIMSAMAMFSTVGENLLLFDYPHGTHDIPHMYHDIPHDTQITKDGIPQGTEQPPWYS